RPGVLEQKIGAGDQLLELGAPRRALRVEDDAALGTIQGMKAQTLQARRQGRVEGWLMSGGTATRRFHLDHVGTQAGQDQPTERRMRLRQVEHSIWTQHDTAFLTRPSRSRSCWLRREPPPGA